LTSQLCSIVFDHLPVQLGVHFVGGHNTKSYAMFFTIVICCANRQMVCRAADV